MLIFHGDMNACAVGRIDVFWKVNRVLQCVSQCSVTRAVRLAQPAGILFSRTDYLMALNSFDLTLPLE